MVHGVILRVLALTVALFGVVTSSHAAENGEGDLAAILKRKKIRIAICTKETPPFFYNAREKTDSDERTGWPFDSGLDMKLVRLLAEKLGHPGPPIAVEWVLCAQFDEVIDAVATNKADIAVSNISITLERAKRVLYTVPYVEMRMAALINRLKIDEQEITELSIDSLNMPTIRIGALSASSYVEFVKNTFPDAKHTFYESWGDLLKNLKQNRIDMVFYDEGQIKRALREDPSLSLRFVANFFDSSREQYDCISIPVFPGNEHLHRWLDNFVIMYREKFSLDDEIATFVSQLKETETQKVTPFGNMPRARFLFFALLISFLVWVAYLIRLKAKAAEAMNFQVWVEVLQKPSVIFSSMLLGCGHGMILGVPNATLVSVGDFYFALLKMCSIPIMMTAIIKGLNGLLVAGLGGRFICKFMTLLMIGLVAASLLGLVGGIFIQPGNVSAEVQTEFGAYVQQASGEQFKHSVYTILEQFIPSNIIKAIIQENTLGLLVFSILFGLSSGFIKKGIKSFGRAMDFVFDSFVQIIQWAMFLLPLALYSLMAVQAASFGTDLLLSMGRLVVGFHVLCFILCIVSLLVMRIILKKSLGDLLLDLKDALFIAFGTSSSFASMPSAMVSLEKTCGLHRGHVRVIYPMGATMFRPGTILTLAFGSVFMAQIMNVSLTAKGAGVIIVVGSVIAGLSVSGAPSVIELAAFSLFFPYIGLPFQVTFILLIGINSILDPIRTVTNVLANCVLTTHLSDMTALENLDAGNPVPSQNEVSPGLAENLTCASNELHELSP